MPEGLKTGMVATESDATLPVGRQRWRIILVCLLLVLATALLYCRSAGYPFINYDDHAYVADNEHVTSGLTLENVKWAFQAGYASNWHPLTWISHMLDCELFGLNAGAMHAVNTLFHAANAALLFLFLRSATGSLWRSVAVAALFAFHPTRVESVAWIAERKDVLAAFFWFLTLLAYQRYTVRPEAGRYGLVVLLLALGLMAKPMAVTLPFALLLLDFWPLNRFQRESFGRLLKEKIPLLVVAAASCVITFHVQDAAGSVVSMENQPLHARIGQVLMTYGFYIGKTLWPTNLFIPYWDELAPTHVVLIGALFSLLVLCFGTIWLRTRFPYLAVGWFWFLGTLIPVIGLVQVGAQSAADRYTYIPSIGLLVAIVWGGRDLVRFLRIPLPIVATITAALLIACAALTSRQLGYWRNSKVLFEHAVATDPSNLLAINLLAWTYAADLDPSLRNGDEAVRLATLITEATERRDAQSLATLAAALAETGNFASAIETAEEALRLPSIQTHPQLMADIQHNLKFYRVGRRMRDFANDE